MSVLLDSLSRLGMTFSRVSGTHGGEWHGPCPACGGTDRCHVWPDQGEAGTWWCRGCDQGGDAISWLQKFEGMNFPDAAAAVGRTLDPDARKKRPPRLSSSSLTAGKQPRQSGSVQPDPVQDPAALWQDHAWKLVKESAERLRNRPDVLAWLAGRGISERTAALCRLGWVEERGRDVFRARSGWGLPETLKDDGTPKKLWIPRGLSIPYFRGETMLRVRIRRAQGEPKYFILPGSASSPLPPMLLKTTAAKAAGLIVTEAELDGIALWQAVGDVVSVLAMGSAQTRPRESAALQAVQSARWIGLLLDRDDAGQAGTDWWLANFSPSSGIHDLRPILPGTAKDPGEAAAALPHGLRPALTQAMPLGFRLMAEQSRVGGLVGKNGVEGGGGKAGAGNVRGNADDHAHVPPAVRELGRLLARCHWVGIEWSDARMGVDVPPCRRDWYGSSKEAKKISSLVFFNADVWDWLDAHPSGPAGINHKNFWEPLSRSRETGSREDTAPGPVETAEKHCSSSTGGQSVQRDAGAYTRQPPGDGRESRAGSPCLPGPGRKKAEVA